MSKKVLVVDDEKLIVKGIRFSLEQEGMEVDCAYVLKCVSRFGNFLLFRLLC